MKRDAARRTGDARAARVPHRTSGQMAASAARSSRRTTVAQM